MNYFAYMRISTQEERAKQKFARQEHSINEYLKMNGIELAVDPFKDDCSGKDFNRPAWNKLYNLLHEGDVIIFKDISRFTRERDNGLEMYMSLLDRKIELIFIDNEPISTPYVKALVNAAEGQETRTIRETMQFIARLLIIVELERVEKERQILIQRTKDGLAASTKRPGRKPGQLDKMTDSLKEDIEVYLSDRSISAITVCRKHKITRNTLKKYVSILKQKALEF